MVRIIIHLFLLTHVLAGITAAAETSVWLDPTGEFGSHELHAPPHEDSKTQEEPHHHFCQHNVLAMTIVLMTPPSLYLRAERAIEPTDLYAFEFKHRLLRPPRS